MSTGILSEQIYMVSGDLGDTFCGLWRQCIGVQMLTRPFGRPQAESTQPVVVKFLLGWLLDRWHQIELANSYTQCFQIGKLIIAAWRSELDCMTAAAKLLLAAWRPCTRRGRGIYIHMSFGRGFHRRDRDDTQNWQQA